MPHADVASIAEGVTTKAGMWNLICRRLESLLDGERNWVRLTSLAYIHM